MNYLFGNFRNINYEIKWQEIINYVNITFYFCKWITRCVWHVPFELNFQGWQYNLLRMYYTFKDFTNHTVCDDDCGKEFFCVYTRVKQILSFSSIFSLFPFHILCVWLNWLAKQWKLDILNLERKLVAAISTTIYMNNGSCKNM